MAKHESTAVNELIDLARTGKSLGDDDDMMFRPPQPAQSASMPVAAAPRPTTIPAASAPRTQMVPSGAFDVGALSSIANPIPQNLRSTRTGLPPPVPARQPTQPPPFVRNRPEGTPAPELIARQPSGTIPPALPPIPMHTPAPTFQSPMDSLAATQLAPETLPPDELRVDRSDGLDIDPSEELPMAALPPLPMANLPPLPVATLPPPPHRMPVAAPFVAAPQMQQQMPQQMPQMQQMPQAPILPPVTLDQSVDENGWFEPSRMVDKVDETWAGTLPVEKTAMARPPFSMKRLRVPAAIAGGVLLLFVIGFFAFDGEGGGKAVAAKPTTTATTASAPAVAAKAEAPAQPAVAQPVVAQAAVAAPAQPEAPVVPAAPAVAAPVVAPATAAAPESTTAFVDVRFDSSPSGATVMLVDGGKTSFLGTTPVSASVDPSRRYDVVFTLVDHPTMLQHLDPTATKHLVAAMAPATTTVATAPATTQPAVQQAPAVAQHAVSQPAVAHTAPPATPPVRAQPKQTQTAAATEDDGASSGGGQGVLMVASKPPCEIFVDGRDTGMTTPQRSIKLAVGAHKVTLVNKAESISKSIDVRINADTPTKLIKNFE